MVLRVDGCDRTEVYVFEEFEHLSVWRNMKLKGDKFNKIPIL